LHEIILPESFELGFGADKKRKRTKSKERSMSKNTTYDMIAQSARDAIQPYLQDKEKLISVAKTLQDSHYKLLTTHAELARTIQTTADNLNEKRNQAQKVLDAYDQHKIQLANMLDLAVGKPVACLAGDKDPLVCTADAIQNSMSTVKTLADQVHVANQHINSLLLEADKNTKQLKEVVATKSQNTVLSQLIQTQLQSIASK
jgi:hypothetical protein